MKLRIRQDHHSHIQPWYRLEQFSPRETMPVFNNGLEGSAIRVEHWALVDSGKDLEYLRQRMYKITSPPPGPQFTVIEEREA